MRDASARRTFALLSAVLAAGLLAYAQLPWVWAQRAERLQHRPDLAFTGTLPLYLDDATVDWSWMRQAKDGRFFFSDLFTTEDHPRNYVNPLFWSMGTLARWLSADVVTIYNLSKVAFGALLLALLYLLAGRLFDKPGERFACFFAFLLSGGWEGPLAFLQRHTSLAVRASSPGWWTPEISTLFSMVLFPHFLAGFAAMIAIALLLLRAWRPGDEGFRPRAAYSAGAGAVLFVLTLFHPYDALTILGTAWATPLLIGLAERRLPRVEALHALVATAVAAPAALYLLVLLRTNPFVRAWDAQNPMPALAPRELVMALGINLLLAAAALARFRSLRRPQLVMLGWLVASLALAYAPLRFQRRMLGGIQFPLAALACTAIVTLLVPAASRWIRSWREGTLATDPAGVRAIVLVALLAPLNVPTPIYVRQQQFRDVRGLRYPSWIRAEEAAALSALERAAPPGSRAMSSYEIGNLLPPRTGVAAYAGHHALTIDWPAKERDVARFYAAGPEDDAWRRELLARSGIGFVLYTARERALGTFDPSTRPWLEEIVVTGRDPAQRAAVYRVR